MEEILKMIEAVDPSDTAKLNEIDARVSVYITKSVTNWHNSLGRAKQYTRSRDALRGIRPNGSSLNLYISIDGRTEYQYWLTTKDNPNPYPYEASDMATEELAELHAIIQAIGFERAQQPTTQSEG